MNPLDNFKRRLDRWTLQVRPKPGLADQATLDTHGYDIVFSTRRDARAAAAVIGALRPDTISRLEKRVRGSRP